MTSTIASGCGPLVSGGGKRRGRKPGLNSTVAQRSAANARERSRMRVLSGAFIELKGALPWVPKDTKLSKLDTLKLAAGYIAYLRRILDTGTHCVTATSTVISDSDEVLTESDSSLGETNPEDPQHLLRLVSRTDDLMANRWLDLEPVVAQNRSMGSPLGSESHNLGQFSNHSRFLKFKNHPLQMNASDLPVPNLISRNLANLEVTMSNTNRTATPNTRLDPTTTRLDESMNPIQKSYTFGADAPSLMQKAELQRLLAPSVKSVWNCRSNLSENYGPAVAEVSENFYRLSTSIDFPAEFVSLSAGEYSVQNSCRSHEFTSSVDPTYPEPFLMHPLTTRQTTLTLENN